MNKEAIIPDLESKTNKLHRDRYLTQLPTVKTGERKKLLKRKGILTTHCCLQT